MNRLCHEHRWRCFGQMLDHLEFVCPDLKSVCQSRRAQKEKELEKPVIISTGLKSLFFEEFLHGPAIGVIFKQGNVGPSVVSFYRGHIVSFQN